MDVPPHVWIGVTCEDQNWFDRRYKYLDGIDAITVSTAYKNSEVGAVLPGEEHTEFCMPLMPFAGSTVGVTATLMMSGSALVVEAGMNGDPGTSVKLPSLAIVNTEMEPETLDCRLATKRNFPAESMVSVDGTGLAFNGMTLPTAVIDPSELTLNA